MPHILKNTGYQSEVVLMCTQFYIHSYFLIKCSPKIGCRFAKLHWYSFHLCLLCTANPSSDRDALNVYAESASAPPTDHWVKQHKLTLIFCTDVLCESLCNCVISAIFHQKCFLFQIFQIASYDAKNIYFTKNIFMYQVQLCQHCWLPTTA